jgi:hypothetical protein
MPPCDRTVCCTLIWYNEWAKPMNSSYEKEENVMHTFKSIQSFPKSKSMNTRIQSSPSSVEPNFLILPTIRPMLRPSFINSTRTFKKFTFCRYGLIHSRKHISNITQGIVYRRGCPEGASASESREQNRRLIYKRPFISSIEISFTSIIT